MGDILIVAEYAEGKVKKSAFELLSKAQDLAQGTGGNIVAVLLGSGVESLAPQLAPYGASKVAVVDQEALAQYNTIAYAKALAAVIEQLKPSLVLGAFSALGRDLFPRVAAKIKAGLSSDTVDLRVDGGKIIAKKPLYSGKALAEVVFNSPVQMVTVRPNSFPIVTPKEGAQAEILKISADLGSIRCALKETIQGVQGKIDLTEAEIIVAGGRALGNADNFKILQELADVVGATLGASRAAVDAGFASHDMQVGQTGKVVNPKLYIACGISGAIQHLAGMRTSKVIVAVNKDPEAPIFSKADYSIVGDLFTVVPLLTQEFKKLLAE